MMSNYEKYCSRVLGLPTDEPAVKALVDPIPNIAVGVCIYQPPAGATDEPYITVKFEDGQTFTWHRTQIAMSAEDLLGWNQDSVLMMLPPACSVEN